MMILEIRDRGTGDESLPASSVSPQDSTIMLTFVRIQRALLSLHDIHEFASQALRQS